MKTYAVELNVSINDDSWIVDQIVDATNTYEAKLAASRQTRIDAEHLHDNYEDLIIHEIVSVNEVTPKGA